MAGMVGKLAMTALLGAENEIQDGDFWDVETTRGHLLRVKYSLNGALPATDSIQIFMKQVDLALMCLASQEGPVVPGDELRKCFTVGTPYTK